VELEASMVRELEPIEPEAETPAVPVASERPAEKPWRRTAMAALTDLATDSDDLTPRRRR
jgi:hypothetical protein